MLLHFTEFKAILTVSLPKDKIVGGVAMLTGSVAGGFIAQISNLGVPYIFRAVFFGITFIVAFIFMKDLALPQKKKELLSNRLKELLVTSIDQGLKKPAIRWVMLTAPL